MNSKLLNTIKMIEKYGSREKKRKQSHDDVANVRAIEK